MHKSRLAGFIIDCQTDDLDAAANDLLVVVRDREGRIVHFNRACQELTGYSLDQVKGRRTWDFLVPANEIPEARTAFDENFDGVAIEHAQHCGRMRHARRGCFG